MAELESGKHKPTPGAWLSNTTVQLIFAGSVAALAGGIAAADVSSFARAAAAGGFVVCVALTGLASRMYAARAIRRATDTIGRFGNGDHKLRITTQPGTQSQKRFFDAFNRAADSLAARESEFELFARATGDAVWDWHIGDDKVVWIHGARKVLGAEEDAFVVPSSWWIERVHPEDRPEVEESGAEISSGRQDFWSVEYRFKRLDGEYSWIWDRSILIRDAEGKPSRIVGYMTDISSRKRAEEMLQLVERRQRALITAVSSIVWREDLAGGPQPRNLAWEEYTGQTQEQEYGEGWLEAVHPDDRENMQREWSTAVRDGAVYQADMRLRRRDGTYRWMSARGAPVRDQQGEVLEFIGLYEDVDDYYSAREELRRKTNLLAERVKELRCLHAITVVSNKDEMRLPEILKGIALILPSAVTRPASATCLIEWRGRTFRSPNYLEPSVTVSVPLEVGGGELGRITLGYTGVAADVVFLPEEEQLLKTAANLVAQMLSRREGRDRLEQQSQELWRRQAMFEQTERLAKVGGWEYDIKTRTMTWSEEVRRIAFPPSEDFGSTGPGLTSAFLHDALEEALRTNQPFDLELPWVLPSGKRKWLHTVGQVQIVNGEAVRIFGIVKDITDEKEARSRIWHMANHDALTGLPNRRYFQEKLEAAYADAERCAGLLIIDLDHFKEVNDTLGHDVGDVLLRAVADRLTEAAGDMATVARLGGDEFAVLAPAVDRAAACAFAEKLMAKLNRPIALAGRMSPVRFSAGLAIAPEDGSAAADLQKNADIALYFGKMRGRAAFVTYAPEMRAMVEHRIKVCSDVREALEADQLVPFYQPKVSLKTGEITGFEALLRWNHPDGLRGPAAVLPAFEDRELAIDMGKRMLQGVIADMLSWRRLGLSYGHVALNASAAEFTGFDLADHVLGRLNAAGLAPHNLGIEVTETVLLGRDAEPVGPILRRLSAAGIQIALDDFGTGYASLTHLQQYPVDIIKIDQTFIRGLTADTGSQAITTAVLGLGSSLGMGVIAEGVETTEHAMLLKAAGCDQAQGFLFAKPMPASDVPGFLRNWNPAQYGLGKPLALSAA